MKRNFDYGQMARVSIKKEENIRLLNAQSLYASSSEEIIEKKNIDLDEMEVIFDSLV